MGCSVPLDSRNGEGLTLGSKPLICVASFMTLPLPLDGFGNGVAVVEIP